MPGCSVPANVTVVASPVPGTSSTDVPSGRVTVIPVAPDGIVRLTGVPGWSASVGAADPPISSPVRLASRIGKATWSGRSDWRGSNARTAVGRPARTARVEERRRRVVPG